MLRLCAILLGLLIMPASTVFAAVTCAVCTKPFGGTFYRFTKRGHDEKVLVCSKCAVLETTCYICSIPVKDNYTKLADGRMMCEGDAKNAVMSQEEGDRLFNDIKREMQSILSRVGALPHHNVSFTLEGKARLDKAGGNVISQHDDSLLLGLTRTMAKKVENGMEFKHQIYLLHGLTRERFMAVAAHEYAHAWLHENVKRKLNQDTVEGFCDWMGYKIIAPKSAAEAKVVFESNYSQGQSRAFIAAEKEYDFYNVIQWVKYGVDPELDPEQLHRVLVLRDRSGSGSAVAKASPSPVFAYAPVAPRAPVTNLVLKGLSGSAARRFALINDGTFMAGEQGKVRLGDSNVVVKCLEIRNDAVVVQVQGEAEPRTLQITASR
jgi:hypothetical protein